VSAEVGCDERRKGEEPAGPSLPLRMLSRPAPSGGTRYTTTGALPPLPYVPPPRCGSASAPGLPPARHPPARRGIARGT
jgi:hypothetical protein